jgi:hypothetical protein
MSISHEFYLAASLRDLTVKGLGVSDSADQTAIRDWSAAHPGNTRAAQYVNDWLPKV